MTYTEVQEILDRLTVIIEEAQHATAPLATLKWHLALKEGRNPLTGEMENTV